MPPAAPEFSTVEPELYDALIDWPRRLANETPLLRELTQRTAARRALDAACGTGQHVELLHGWGLEVTGADASPAMIAYNRRRYGEHERLRWVVRSFETLPGAGQAGSFDLVLCLGNSLALAGDEPAIRASVRAMLDWLRPGGVLILQVLNLWKLPEGKTIWQKCLQVDLAGARHTLLKGIHCTGGRGYIDLIDLTFESDGVRPRYDQAVFCGVQPEWLTDVAAHRGAEVELFGSYQREAYKRESSPDLIALIRPR